MSENNEKEICKRTRLFAIEIIKIVNFFPKTSAGFQIGQQIIGSGTSVGANMEEAQDAISRKEFIKIINISLKEVRETIYWLKLIKESKLIISDKIDYLLNEASQLRAIIAAIIRKTRGNNSIKQ